VFEADNDVDIDVLATQVSEDVEDLLAFDLDGIPAKLCFRWWSAERFWGRWLITLKNKVMTARFLRNAG
jgi:hypothetical protein